MKRNRSLIIHSTAVLIALLVLGILSLGVVLGALREKLNASNTRVTELTERITELEQSYCTTEGVITAGATARYSISSGDRVRTYNVHTPTHYDPRVRYPVIINFDGIGGSARHIEAYSGIDKLPVISVYPDATLTNDGYTAWQGAPYSKTGVDDVRFVRDILEQLPSRYCTDVTRVFAVGMSNGGGFVALAACELGDRLRAVASISGAYYTSCDDPENLPSILAIHSIDDGQVPFTGSLRRKLPAVRDWTYRQALARGCTTQPVQITDKTIRYAWTQCKVNDASLELLVVRHQSHGWLSIPPSTQQPPVNTARYIWNFFERQ
jgi:polyhydroxybutyrate depolymerase